MIKRRYFGTDGVRGKANESPMDAVTAMRIGMAAGHYFMQKRRARDGRHRVVMGKDTRLSGYMLEQALTAGFLSVGMDVMLLGPVPTPAVAMLTKSLRADLGVMISASHNPYDDNGIKLFDYEGAKLSDEVEQTIESLMEKPLEKLAAESKNLGRAKRIDDAAGRYVEFVKQTFPRGKSLAGLKIVLDCAHGAAYKMGPEILWELGAEVIPLGVQPDGFNINAGCGSTAPELLCKTVREKKAHIGLALDGDADRIIICDEQGKIVDGDQIIALIATRWKKSGLLSCDKVVSTQMSNLGLEQFLGEKNIQLVRAAVGDRYVTAEMQKHGANLGGEPSGHIILRDYATTGDALIAGLQILGALVESGKSASKVLHQFNPLPQILKNVVVAKKDAAAILNQKNVKASIEKAQKSLGKEGRVFVRSSGTEAKIRIMVEGKSRAAIEAIADSIADTIRAA